MSFQEEFNFRSSIKSLGGHGVLDESDCDDLADGTARVMNLMKDGRWYTVDEIELAAGKDGVPAREGLRRMRELRKHGWNVEKIRSQGRDYMYRIARAR